MAKSVDASASPADPTPRRRLRLTTVGGVRREMAAVYTDARTGRLDPTAASKLTYMLTSIAKVMETSDFEARIAALEAGRVKQEKP
ncbi:MAG: hypothetical protein GX652_09735 [Burkholderiaceae bacterium]|nr:hypothetical protein [Burkholderiaceae bacterium]